MTTNPYIPNDPLCHKVYRWEDAQWLAGVEVFAHKLVRHWIKKAAKLYSIDAPTVRFLPATSKTSGYDPKRRCIGLVPHHCNPVIVAHEAAHHICDRLTGPDRAHHSHEWFSIFMWLLLKFEVYEPSFLRASLKPYGLRLRPLSPERFR